VKSRRIVSLLALALPPVLLAAVGIWASRSEEARLERETQKSLQRRLEVEGAALADAVARLEKELLAATEGVPDDPVRMRDWAGQNGRRRNLLLLDAAGRLVFPPPEAVLPAGERRFVEQTRPLWQRGSLAFPAIAEGTGPASGHGWQNVGWGDGGALFWRRASANRRVVVEVPAATLLSTFIAALPTTVGRGGGKPIEERIALYDGNGHVAYQWGRHQPPAGARPLQSLALAPPFESWRLGYLGPPPPRPRAWGLAAGIASLAFLLALAGIWRHRESERAAREARQRVNFVNQVSHELKTPLTNVRLYAELLEDHLPEDDAVARQRLEVLLGECRRLGRLIGNVLTFARSEKGVVAIHRAPASADELIRELIGQFKPALDGRGIAVRFEAGAPRPVGLDADALAQILGNLFGNVEKYAPGAPLVVRSEQATGVVSIAVADGGPGIPATAREQIFEPFFRLESARLEAVPGTGIGLGIARDLARLHGGDLRVDSSDAGARFIVTIAVEEMT
jgi:signal transduction histidine kinase